MKAWQCIFYIAVLETHREETVMLGTLARYGIPVREYRLFVFLSSLCKLAAGKRSVCTIQSMVHTFKC